MAELVNDNYLLLKCTSLRCGLSVSHVSCRNDETQSKVSLITQRHILASWQSRFIYCCAYDLFAKLLKFEASAGDAILHTLKRV
jgi:hypothetical protein